MAHPIIVDSVENAFIPLLIYNNQSSDTAMLKQFNEPAWNYQVIRFLNAKGEDILPRKDKIWTLNSLVPRMVSALTPAKRPVPPALHLLHQEQQTKNHAQAAFSQYCFWTGEQRLGGLKGVILTEAGWIHNKEVTLVTYDQTQLSLRDLIRHATAFQCADQVFVPHAQLDAAKKLSNKPVEPLTEHYKKAKEADQKRQLRGTPFAKLTLTASQATKINAFARTDSEKAQTFLTKKQRAEYMQ